MKRVILFIVSNRHKARALKEKLGINRISTRREFPNMTVIVDELDVFSDINKFNGIECSAIWMDEAVDIEYAGMLRSRCRGQGKFWEVFDRLPFDSMELITELFDEGRNYEAWLRRNNG